MAAALLAWPAYAQPRQSGETQAEELFQNAKKHFAAKRFAEACPMFAESYRLDVGGGTLQNLALCYEELGKTATAYARFQELRTMSKRADPVRLDRVKLADEHIAKLTPRLARVRLVVRGARAGLVVKIDDVIYEEVSWSAGVLLDPGEHPITVTAPGKKPFSVMATARAEGGFADIEIPALEDVPKAPPESAPLAPAPPVALAGPVHPLRSVGFVIGGIGVLALGAGSAFGVLTITTNQAGKDRCSGAANDQVDGSGHCFAGSRALTEANHEKDKAGAFGTAASVLMPIGAIAIGLAAYFILHSAGSEKTSARVRPALQGGLVEGEF